MESMSYQFQYNNNNSNNNNNSMEGDTQPIRNILPGVTNSVQQNGLDAEDSQILLSNVIYGSHLLRLHKELSDIVQESPRRWFEYEDIAFVDPNALPNYWVSKWVDDVANFGFGYQLSDETVGVVYKDETKMIQSPDKSEVEYYDTNGDMKPLAREPENSILSMKMNYLHYMKSFMASNLVKTGANVPSNRDQILPRPQLHSFCQTKSAVIMHLNNGTVQFNFFDHVKLIISLRKGSVTYVNEEGHIRSFWFSTLLQQGCSLPLHQRLSYAKMQIGKMIDNRLY